MAVTLPPRLIPPSLAGSQAPDVGRLERLNGGSARPDSVAMWGFAKKAGARILEQTLPWIVRDPRARGALSKGIADRMWEGGVRQLLERTGLTAKYGKQGLEYSVNQALRGLKPGQALGVDRTAVTSRGFQAAARSVSDHFEDAARSGVRATDGRRVDAWSMMNADEQLRVLNGLERAFVGVLDEWSVGLGSASLGLGAGAGIGATLTHLLHHLRGTN